MIDSHCHLDFSPLSDHLEQHLDSARASGVSTWIVPGCDPKQWRSLARFETVPGVHLGVGLHPWWVGGQADDWLEQLERHARQLGVVAIGECGVDNKKAEADLEQQQSCFEAQLALARELSLPLIIHQVGGQQQFLESVKRVGVPPAGAVVHGFSGDAGWAKGLVQRGFYLGLGVAVTRARRKRLREAARVVPLDRLLLETDAPDQAPEGRSAGQGRPDDVRLVADALAALRDENVEELVRAADDNCQRLFRLSDLR